MPFSKNTELPKSIKDVLPNDAQTVFRNVVNSQMEKGLSEERAIASAWSTLKRQGWEKQASGKWAKISKSEKDIIINAIEPGEDKNYLGLEFGVLVDDIISKGHKIEEFVLKAENAINSILGQGFVTKNESTGSICRFCEQGADKILLSSGGTVLTHCCNAHIDDAVNHIVRNNQDSIKLIIDLKPDNTDSAKENESKIVNININGVPFTSEEINKDIIAAINKALDKEIKDEILKEEGDTSPNMGDEFWRISWDKLLPSSGEGRFIYHHHFRGLDSENVKMDHGQLHDANMPVHGDLRLEADDSLWGITVNIGLAIENKGSLEKFLSGDERLSSTFKLAQPKTWLDAGVDSPLIVEPGMPGATNNSFAKMFVLDKGTYSIGVRTRSLTEIFLNGEVLKGRYLMQYILDSEGDRRWAIMRPIDQEPIASSNEMSKFARELKERGHKRMIWAKPGDTPVLIDVNTLSEIINKEYFFDIEKAEVKKEQQLVTGVVMEPDVKDSHGDFQSSEEIEKASHNFMLKSQTIGLQHKKKGPVEVVESFIAPDNLKIGGQKVIKGSWIMTVKVHDKKIWKMVKEGKFTGFSIGGFAVKS